MKTRLQRFISLSLLFAFISGATLSRASAQDSASGQAVADKARKQGNRWLEPIKLKGNAPLWERYLQAGQTFEKKGDMDSAKRYYFEALTQLERSPRTSAHMTAKISRLEGAIMRLYPNYPKESAFGEGAAQIKIDEEEVAVLQRLVRINQIYPNGSPLMTKIVETQIRYANEDLNKNKSAAAVQKRGSAENKSSTN